MQRIENKIKDGEIPFFGYNEFSNIKLIGKGTYGKVYKADVINHGEIKVVALKKFIDAVDDVYVKEVQLISFIFAVS